MTLPFENDTSAVVKRLSNRNVAANRKRNILIYSVLATLVILISYTTGSLKKQSLVEQIRAME